MSRNLLHSLTLPNDLKQLPLEDLEELASNIREELVSIGDQCGGHLASNLGVVELTIVLHALFDSPKDKFVWDTSHQTYVHKMLTGRLNDMYSIRQLGGLSGFAKIAESEHDAFGAGHASTALSAGVGLAQARDITGEDYSVVSVVGDSALSGGMVFEALNNIDKLNSNFICVLNDNDMSISPPIGSMATYMTKLRTSTPYVAAKGKFERIVSKIPKVGEPLTRRVEKMVDRIRDTILDAKFGVIFEEFGFKYLGPIDGHDIAHLMAALRFAKRYNGPILLHINTTKGKGLEAAEQDPVTFHGVSPKTTSPSASATPKPLTYTQIFGDEVIKLADRRDDVVVITPAMREGSGLTEFERRHPDRFYDVGIAEEHAVTFAAGLSRAGVKPVLAIYSTFLQRGVDQLVHDACLQKLPMVLALDRAGLVGEDGPTHHGVLDYNFLLPIPEIVILAPKNEWELRHMLQWAADQDKIVSIRYPKGPAPQFDTLDAPIEFGKSELIVDAGTSSTDVLLIAAGSMVRPAVEAATELRSRNLATSVINLRFIKPLDLDLIHEHVNRSARIFVLEEGNPVGGIFSHILDSLSDSEKPRNRFHQIALPDAFIEHGNLAKLKSKLGLDADGIVNTVLTTLSKTPSTV